MNTAQMQSQGAPAPQAPSTPTIEEVVDNLAAENQSPEGNSPGTQPDPAQLNNEREQEAPKNPVEQNQENFNKQFEKNLELEREIWKVREGFRKEKQSLQDEIAALKQQIQEKPASNPNADFLSEIFGNEEGTQESQSEKPAFNPDEFKQQILDEIESRQTKANEDATVQQNVEQSIKQANDFVKENAETYPFTANSGNAEMIIDVMSAEFDKNCKTYGEEKALDLIQGFDYYAKKVEAYLENNFQTMLKSDTFRKKLQGYLGNQSKNPEPDQSNSGPQNLSNSDFVQTNQGQKTDLELTDEDRFNQALELLPG